MFLGDLFSSFDYSSTSWVFLESLSKLNWGVCLVFVVLCFNKCSWFLVGKLGELKKESQHSSWFHSYFFDLLLILIFLNLGGLSPYMFSNTSHIFFVFFISGGFWVSLFLSNVFVSPFKFLYLFFPLSPGFILPFLNLMEIVSFFIRPLTLMLRLSMKITTGHIFVVLLSSCLTFLFLTFSPFFLFVFPISMFFFLFESCIGVIQGLVFFLLLKSYLGEHQKEILQKHLLFRTYQN